ncbi:MAG: hypothetical protein WC997_02475 [Porticoccaceae bacterium]
MQPLSCQVTPLIADPVGLSRYGSFLDAVKATLLHPRVIENIERVERELLKGEQVECPVIHRFGPGIYIREITMPAGSFVIGARHKCAQLNIMLAGRVTVLNGDGTTRELVAPMTFTGGPGKKVGYIHEDVVWQNVYATDETDIETLENLFVDKGEPWHEAMRRRRPTLTDQYAQIDYWKMLAEYGISHDTARSESENTADMRPFPDGSYKVMVTDSAIEGRGLFATAAIVAGEVIAPARIGTERTPAGRYTNHSPMPNAEFVVLENGDLDLVAIKNITGLKGGMPGEEITIDYRAALEIRKRLCPQRLQQQ